MSVRTTELSRLKAPIKKQLRHLDGESRRKFPDLLKETVEKLRKEGYKLTTVTKTYRDKNNVCSDSYWRKEERIKGIKIIWLCTFTIVFNKKFKFKFDFDCWFEFSKFLQNLRESIYGKGFPATWNWDIINSFYFVFFEHDD